MNVLLVYPNVRGMNMLPPAIALFSALLKRDGHKVFLFDSTDYRDPTGVHEFNSDKTKEENLNARPFDDAILRTSYTDTDIFEAYLKKVEEANPSLIAMSTTEDMFPLGISLLSSSRHLKIPTIVGGVFPTFAAELALSYEEIDMVGVGEGEKLLPDLCRRMELGHSYDDLPNLWVKGKDGTIKRNRIDNSVDIDKNPFLDLSIFRESRLYRPMQGKVWKMLPLETHRGCPYRCAFCNSPSQWDLYSKETSSSHFRKKKPSAVRDEIKFFVDTYDVEAFYFWADTFFAYSSREFDEFIEMYSEFKIPFWCQTRAETVTAKRIEQLIDVGLFRMAFGVEHGNAEFRKKYIKRDISNDAMINAFKTVEGIGVPFSVNNILGFPYETRTLTFDTIEVNRQFNADNHNAYSFSPFHGTPLRTIAEKEGYIEKGFLSRSITNPTILNMPQYSASAIDGMRRCFVLYAKLPKSRWPEIEKAEQLTAEGDEIWEILRGEVKAMYEKDQWSKMGNFEELAMGV